VSHQNSATPHAHDSDIWFRPHCDIVATTCLQQCMPEQFQGLDTATQHLKQIGSTTSGSTPDFGKPPILPWVSLRPVALLKFKSPITVMVGRHHIGAHAIQWICFQGMDRPSSLPEFTCPSLPLPKADLGSCPLWFTYVSYSLLSSTRVVLT